MNKYRLVILIIIFVNSIIIAQEEKNDQDLIDNPLERYDDTLKYGIESSIISTIEELRELKIPNYDKKVFDSISFTKDEALIVAGISYLRDMKSNIAIDYSLDIIENYNDYTKRSVQFATFYISDNVDGLTNDNKNELKKIILEIIDTDDPGLALAVLELLSNFYSEKNVEYIAEEKN